MADDAIIQIGTNINTNEAVAQLDGLKNALQQLANILNQFGVQSGSTFNAITKAIASMNEIDPKTFTNNLQQTYTTVENLTKSIINTSNITRTTGRDMGKSISGMSEQVRQELLAVVQVIEGRGNFASRLKETLSRMLSGEGISLDFIKNVEGVTKSSVDKLVSYLASVDLSDLQKKFNIHSKDILLDNSTLQEAKEKLQELRQVVSQETTLIRGIIEKNTEDGTLSAEAFNRALEGMFHAKLAIPQIDVLDNFVQKAEEAQKKLADSKAAEIAQQKITNFQNKINDFAQNLSAEIDAVVKTVNEKLSGIKGDFIKTDGLKLFDASEIEKQKAAIEKQIKDYQSKINRINSSQPTTPETIEKNKVKVAEYQRAIDELNQALEGHNKLLASINQHNTYVQQNEEVQKLASSLQGYLDTVRKARDEGKDFDIGQGIRDNNAEVEALKGKLEELNAQLAKIKSVSEKSENLVDIESINTQIKGVKELIKVREDYAKRFEAEQLAQKDLKFKIDLESLKQSGKEASEALGDEIKKALAEASANLKEVEKGLTAPIDFSGKIQAWKEAQSQLEAESKKTQEAIIDAERQGNKQQELLLRETYSQQLDQIKKYKSAVEKLEVTASTASTKAALNEQKQQEAQVLRSRVVEYKKFEADIGDTIANIRKYLSNITNIGSKDALKEVLETASTKLDELYTRVDDFRKQRMAFLDAGDIERANELSRAIEAIAPKARTLENAINNLGQAWNEANDETGRNAELLEDSIRAVEKNVTNLRYAFGEIAKGFWWIQDTFVSNLVPTITSLTKQLQSSLSGGNIFKSFFSDSFNMGGEFEAQMTRVKVVSGSTEEELKVLIDTARDMGEKLPLTAKQVAEGMEILAQRGHKTAEILSLINDVSNLSISQNIEMAKSAELLGATIVNFGKSLSDASAITDMFNNASNNSALNINRLMEAMRYVAPAAGSLGYELKDMVGVLQVMSNAGLTGEMIGTGLAHMITKIGGEAEILGVRTRYLDGTARSLVDILKELKERGTTVSDVYNVFGQRTTKAATAAIQGADALDELIKKSEQAGSTQNAVNEMMQTWPNTILKFQSAVQELHIEVFNQLEDRTKGLINDFTSLVRVFTDWIKRTNVVGEILNSFMEGLSYKFPSENSFEKFLNSINIDDLKEIASEFGRYFKNLIDTIQAFAPVVTTVIKTIYKNFVLFDRITFYVASFSSAISTMLKVVVAAKVIPAILSGIGIGLQTISGGATVASTTLMGLSGTLGKIAAFLLNWKVIAVAIAALTIAGITGFASWSESAKDNSRKIIEAYEDVKKRIESVYKELQNYGGTGYEITVDVVTTDAIEHFGKLKNEAEQKLDVIKREIEDTGKKINEMLAGMGDKGYLQEIVHNTSIETKKLIGIMETIGSNTGIYFDKSQIQQIEEYRAKLDAFNEAQQAASEKNINMQKVFNDLLKETVSSFDVQDLQLGRIEGIENIKEAQDELLKLGEIVNDDTSLSQWASKLTNALASIDVFKTLSPLEKHILNIAANSSKMGLDVRTAYQQVLSSFTDLETKLKELDLSNPVKQAEAMAKQIKTHINDAIKSFGNVSTSLEVFNTNGLFSRFELEGEAIKSAQASLEKYSKELAKQHGYSEDAARVIVLDQLQKAIENATDEQTKYNLELIKYGKIGVAKGLFSELTQEARELKQIQEYLADANNNSKYLNTSLVPIIQNLQEMLGRTSVIDTHTGRLNETWIKLKDTIATTINSELERTTNIVSVLAKHMDNIDFDKLSLSLKPLLSGMKPIEDMTGQINEGFVKALDTLKELRDMKFTQAQKQLQYIIEAAKNGYMSFKDVSQYWDKNKVDVITKAVTDVGDPKAYTDMRSYYIAVATAVQMAAKNLGIFQVYATDVRRTFGGLRIEKVGEAFVKIANDTNNVSGAYHRMSASFREGLPNISFPNLNESIVAPLQRISATINTSLNKVFFGAESQRDKLLTSFENTLKKLGTDTKFDDVIIEQINNIEKAFQKLGMTANEKALFENFRKISALSKGQRLEANISISSEAKTLLDILKASGGNFSSNLQKAFSSFKTSYEQIVNKPNFARNFGTIADAFSSKIKATINEIEKAGKTDIFSKEIAQWQAVLAKLQALKKEASKSSGNFNFTQEQPKQNQSMLRLEIDGKNVLDKIGTVITSQNQALSSSILNFGKELTDASMIFRSASDTLNEASKNLSTKQESSQPQTLKIDGIDEIVRKFGTSIDSLGSVIKSLPQQPQTPTSEDRSSEIVKALENLITKIPSNVDVKVEVDQPKPETQEVRVVYDTRAADALVTKVNEILNTPVPVQVTVNAEGVTQAVQNSIGEIASAISEYNPQPVEVKVSTEGIAEATRMNLSDIVNALRGVEIKPVIQNEVQLDGLKSALSGITIQAQAPEITIDTQSIVTAIERQGRSVESAIKAIAVQDVLSKILTAVSQDKKIEVETVVDFDKVINAINNINTNTNAKVTLDAQEFVQAVALFQRIASEPRTITLDVADLKSELDKIASKEIPAIDTSGIERAISSITISNDTEGIKDLRRAMETLSKSIEAFNHSTHGLKNAVYSNDQEASAGIDANTLAIALNPLNEALHGIISELQENTESVNLTPLVNQIKVLAENVRQPANVTFNIDTVQASNTGEATKSLSQAMGMYARQQNMGWNIGG